MWGGVRLSLGHADKDQAEGAEGPSSRHTWPQMVVCYGSCLVSLTQFLLFFIHLLSNIWLLWWRMGKVIVHCRRESQV